MAEQGDDLPPLDPLLVEFVRALARDHARQDIQKREEERRQREEADARERQRLGVGYGHEFDLVDGDVLMFYVAHGATSADAHRLMRAHAKAHHPKASVHHLGPLSMNELVNERVPVGTVKLIASSAPTKGSKQQVVQRWRKIRTTKRDC
ncbi:hypothetical protein [Microvirga lenta]|uniref:hypothetical protein n=1 Tax=Microvirga lenta TaxID=2881337 RepID=UPI001CFF70C1|nr:hypothetical protein [Microvirga lenta]MCB5176776.1 hypothetical protein [Microvirga lenta]